MASSGFPAFGQQQQQGGDKQSVMGEAVEHLRQAQVNPSSNAQAALAQAKYEMQGVTEMFNRMSDACFDKCITKFKDTELHVGEMSCVDRCVLKYMQTQAAVGERLAHQQQAQAQAMQAMQQQQQ